VEGMRELVLSGYTTSALMKAILIPTAVCVASILFAQTELRRRLAAK